MKKHKVNKTYQEINAKIRSGEVVVVTAEEIIGIVEKEGTVAAAKKLDVVTTGTFAPMCSSGAFLNFGHSKPGIKAQTPTTAPAKRGKRSVNHILECGPAAGVEGRLESEAPTWRTHRRRQRLRA